MRIVNPDEQILLNQLKAAGIIAKLDPLQMEDGVLCGCGDRDRCGDLLKHHEAKLLEAGRSSRLHLVMLNGGPLNLVHRHQDDARATEAIHNFCFSQLRGGVQLKNLRRIILVGHWPCGQAELWGMPMEEAFHALARAADTTSYRLSDLSVEVVARIHLHKADAMNTYHFRAKRWLTSRHAA